MLKSYGLIDTIWFDSDVSFPLKIGDRYVLRELYKSNFKHQSILKEWELTTQNSTGKHAFIIEIKKEHEAKDFDLVFNSVSNLITLLRLIKYNRIYLCHLVCIENKTAPISGSLDSPRPSSFKGNNEEVSRLDIRSLNKITKNIRELVINNNQRVLRAFLFWNSASCSGTFERKVVEIFISLESLFTKGSEDVTFRLASRMSWFLESRNSSRRLELYKKIKVAYNVRSNIVHGRSFLESKDLPLIQEIHSYCRDILLKIFLDKRLLVIFSGEDMEEYFNHLIMGNKLKRI